MFAFTKRLKVRTDEGVCPYFVEIENAYPNQLPLGTSPPLEGLGEAFYPATGPLPSSFFSFSPFFFSFFFSSSSSRFLTDS